MNQFRDAIATYFRARPNVWLAAAHFEAIGGRCAWRTRISDCRRELGMVIENRQRRVKRPDGSTWTLSEYKYVPSVQANRRAGDEKSECLPWGAAEAQRGADR